MNQWERLTPGQQSALLAANEAGDAGLTRAMHPGTFGDSGALHEYGYLAETQTGRFVITAAGEALLPGEHPLLRER